LRIHSAGYTAGAGKILLGDGSAEQCFSEHFRASSQPDFNPTSNWPDGHVPSFPSTRVFFP